MSRLQVGGLALEITSGNVVLLKRFDGDTWGSDGKFHHDVWFVESAESVFMTDTKTFLSEFYAESRELIPLGDKQKQDELAKEKELEVT